MAWFDCATHRPIHANTGGPMSSNLGLLLHHAVTNGSLYTFFNNPSAQVSAHFWVAKDGTIEQYVDSNIVAWHAMQMNDTYCGVETEGCTTPPHAEPMTPAMVNSLAVLYAEGHRRHGWPNNLANRDGEYGFGFHRMGVQTACPCDARLNMRPTILAQAFHSTPAPERDDAEMIASTSTGNGYWTATYDGAVSAFGDAQYHGNVWGKLGDTHIVGIAGKSNSGYRLLASDGGVFCFGSAGYHGRPDRV